MPISETTEALLIRGGVYHLTVHPILHPRCLRGFSTHHHVESIDYMYTILTNELIGKSGRLKAASHVAGGGAGSTGKEREG